MDLTIPDEAIDLAAAARQVFDSTGMEVARQALEKSTEAADRAHTLLRAVGMEDLQEIGSDEIHAYGAALLAQEAGRVALPAPIAALLAGQVAEVDAPVHAVASIDAPRILVDHVRARHHSMIVDISGRSRAVHVKATGGESSMLAAQSALVDPTGDIIHMGVRNIWAWHEVFSAFDTIGALSRALDLAKQHLNERFQFGKPLRVRQALEFRFVDATVQFRGLKELALFSIWNLHHDPDQGVGTALMLRLAHLEAIRDVMRHIHQIHGAIGFCFEHDLAMISQHLQFRRYQPLSLSRTTALLGQRLDDIPALFTPSALG